MNKKKVLKTILLVVLLIIAALVVYTLRNFIIVKGLQNKIAQYTSISNFSATINQTFTDDSTNVLINYYQDGNKQAVILQRTDSNGEVIKMSQYNNVERCDVFWDAKDSKTAQLNAANTISIQLTNSLETDNDWQTLLACTFAVIKSTNYNGKDCYSITNYMSPLFMNGTEKNEVYVDKETGIAIKNIMDKQITEKEYNFNTVDESVFTEPDIGQYTLK